MSTNLPMQGSQKTGLIHRLRERLNDQVELMTGIAASGRDDLTLSLGHALQGALKLQFFETLMDEMDSYREKGRIKDDDLKTKQGQACFMEMLNFLDGDNPDDIRFEFMKKLYLGIMSDDERDRESVLEQQYMSFCRKLTAGEIMTLVGAWKYAQKQEGNPSYPSDAWYKQIAGPSKLIHDSLAQYYGKMLEEKGIFGVRILVAGRERTITGLTTLATEILKYIESYEIGAVNESQA